MKINHVVASIDVSTGGPARSITHLIQGIIDYDNSVVFELNTCTSVQPIIKTFNHNKSEINFHEHFINYSNSLKKQLIKSETSIFHGHGLWQFPVHHMSRIAKKRNIPYIITPRGMLEPWPLSQGKFKKKVALTIFQKKDLQSATCIHATSKMELQNIRKLGYKNPIAIIPNGINIKNYPSSIPKNDLNKKTILFLSRIHKKKGVENLIDAWYQINPKIKQNWNIKIIGNGDPKYINSLKQKIISRKLTNQIKIIRPVYGKEKINIFRNAKLFVLPTFSENFGIVIAEALAAYTPVITTTAAPWGDLHKENCGWWIKIGVNPLKVALEDAITKKDADLMQLGINGRKLIEKKYSIKSISKKMTLLYKWILNKRNKPDFVNLV